jgi:hypothetical protein
MATQAPKQGRIEQLKSSPRAQRRLFTAALVVFAVGAVALTFSLFRNTSTNQESAFSNEPAQILKSQKAVPLSEEAKAAATTWILGAVTRKDLKGTFDLTHPDIRGSMSRAEWETGNIPVIPYPVDEIDPARWQIDYSYADEALVEIGLTPAKGSSEKKLTFFIGIKKVGTGDNARWVVNYWSPRYKPPLPLAQ